MTKRLDASGGVVRRQDRRRVEALRLAGPDPGQGVREHSQRGGDPRIPHGRAVAHLAPGDAAGVWRFGPAEEGAHHLDGAW